MSEVLWSLEFTSITQILIFVALAIYLLTHRKDPSLVVSRPRLGRLAMVMLVFLYFVWSWASVVLPALRTINLLGMIGINLLMLGNLVATRLERPYRRALAAFGRDPEQETLLEDARHSGRRFYNFAYLGLALVSGIAPWQFLRETARERVHADIQEALAGQGKRSPVISFKGMAAFLQDRLAQDEFLPPEFKEVMQKDIQRFAQHTWAEEQVNEYLSLVLENPEELLTPRLIKAVRQEAPSS